MTDVRVLIHNACRVQLPVAALCGLLLSAGCGGGKVDYPAAKLEGAVTVAGKPLADGLIMFMPQERGRGSGVRAPIKNGRYSADKVPLGEVLVTFNALQETGRKVESVISPGKPLPEQVDLIPEQYRSGIALEVTGDKANQDFSL
jgi:hypothetical protein